MRLISVTFLFVTALLVSFVRANQEQELGRVLVEFYADEGGKTSDIRVLESTDPRYSEAAVKGVQKWTIDPKYRNQKWTMPIVFTVPPDEVTSDSAKGSYDVILRHGTIYDGSGGRPFVGDVALKADRIAAVGTLGAARAAREIDATGLAIAPGFINMLSQSQTALLQDGRSQGEIRQGVTLEVMGEGSSMGPLNAAMKAEMAAMQGDIKFPVTWTTLGEYLTHLEQLGVSCNVASFVGAGGVREHELGKANRAPTPAELARMQALVRQAMEEGAMGLSTALIYIPGVFAQTDEIIALARAAAPYGGRYISHMRSEGNQLLQSLDELITIAREANIPAEVFHLKAAGALNWPKLDQVIARIEAARKEGLAITADMYKTTRPPRPGSMPPCRRGCRRAATRRGPRGSAIRRSASGCAGKCAPPATPGKTTFFSWGRPRRCCWWDSKTKN